MVNNDGGGFRAHHDEASHFVCGVEEGSAKVMEIVEDGDLPCAICHEEKTIGLVEPRHFYVKVCFEVHRAGETGDVLVAGLIHHGERVEEGFPGGMEGHGAVFYFYVIATAADGFSFDNDIRIGRIMTKGSLQGIWQCVASSLSAPVSIGDTPVSIRYWSLAWYPLETCQYPLDTGIWRGREIPANSILATASK
jgi:hypothetical protein